MDQYSHGSLGHGHTQILYDMIRVLAAPVGFERVPHADRLLSVPRGVIQTGGCQNYVRRHRRVQRVVRAVLHRSQSVRIYRTANATVCSLATET